MRLIAIHKLLVILWLNSYPLEQNRQSLAPQHTLIVQVAVCIFLSHQIWSHFQKTLKKKKKKIRFEVPSSTHSFSSPSHPSPSLTHGLFSVCVCVYVCVCLQVHASVCGWPSELQTGLLSAVTAHRHYNSLRPNTMLFLSHSIPLHF